jgi:hypothetical protein
MPAILLGLFLLGLSVVMAEAGKESIKSGLRELEEHKRQQLK